MSDFVTGFYTKDGIKKYDYNSLANLPEGITDVTNTVISPNADYAEVGEWFDGNPNKEDRLGYFVAIAKVGDNTIKIRKATSTDDVRGVSVYNPAFSGNASRDKYGKDGELLPQYNYIGIMGIVEVIDNGKCSVGGRCMPSDDGIAVPSTNNMGYAVLERVDNRHVLIAVEPGADMIQRIKTDVDELLLGGEGSVVTLYEELTKQARLVEQIKLALEEKRSAVGIESIEKAYTEGLVDTYTVMFTDGTSSVFTVTNGEKGERGPEGKSAYEYAVEAGYTGTEEEFGEKLAADYEEGGAGADGLSAYEIAVNNGFEGTEQEWLDSLVGADGESGEQGAQGYSIVASVSRTFTDAQWNTYGTIGHVENWANTSCTGVAIGDLFLVVGLASDTGEGHMMVYKHTAEKNNYQLNGKCIAHHIISARGAKGDKGDPGEIDTSLFQTKTDDALDTDDKTIVGAINGLRGDITTIVDKTVDNVRSIDTNNAGVSELLTYDGIQWKDEFRFYNRNETNGLSIANGEIYQRVPIVAGDNVTFTVDEENQVVKINATGGGSGLENVSTLDTWYDTPANVHAYPYDGISWNDRFAFLDENDGELKTGTITQRIPVIAGKNVTFSYDEENNAIAINAEGGSSTDDSMVGTWVFYDTPSFAGVEYNTPCYFDFTVAGEAYSSLLISDREYGMPADFITYSNDERSLTAYSSEPVVWLTGGWDKEEYKTIVINTEPEEEWLKTWIKNNAIKQSSNGSTKAMPTIRFAGATANEGWYMTEGVPVTFTVEITDGTVQEGDRLQICCKRMYHKKPNRRIWRLRSMENYTITADDVGKRFLSIVVTGEPKTERWLFRSDSNNISNSLSSIFFRIKRVTKRDVDGQECDAIFSNIERVNKKFKTADYKLSIK